MIETEYGGEFTKEIKEVIAQFELNNLTKGNGKIEIFFSPNRQWNAIGSDPTQN